MMMIKSEENLFAHDFRKFVFIFSHIVFLISCRGIVLDTFVSNFITYEFYHSINFDCCQNIAKTFLRRSFEMEKMLTISLILS